MTVPAEPPRVDVSDDSFVPLAPARLAPHLDRPSFLRRSLPGVHLSRCEDRGVKGRRWQAVAGPLGRRWDGTAEVWLEPWHDGTLVHLYVRLRPRRRRLPLAAGARRARRMQDRVRRTWKRELHAWRDGRRDAGDEGTGR